MRLSRYTTRIKSGIEDLICNCFLMKADESRIMLNDAVENGDCFLRLAEDKPVSVVLTKRVKLRFGNAERRGTYLFGVCTAPVHRCAGYATELIEEACSASDADFAVLIPEKPSLFEFYDRLGFLPYGIGYSFETAAVEYESVSVCDGESAYAAYVNAASKCDNICLLSESDFAASAALSPRVCVVGNSGVCFVSPDGAEAFSLRESVRGLAASALALCGMPTARVTVPASCAPDAAEPVKIGMIKSLSGEPAPKSFYINNLFNL